MLAPAFRTPEFATLVPDIAGAFVALVGGRHFFHIRVFNSDTSE